MRESRGVEGARSGSSRNPGPSGTFAPPSIDSEHSDRTGVILLGFGEPETLEEEVVRDFLEGIFEASAVRDGVDPQEARNLARPRATARAPALLEDYLRIGGSPLVPTARKLAGSVQRELCRRRGGATLQVEAAMQFTPPRIPDVVARLREGGCHRLVAIPLFPLCGPTTSVAALGALDRELMRVGWNVPRAAVAGWHHHPGYVHLRADGVRTFCRERGLDLAGSPEGETLLYFSAHGTPLRYLDEGSRYGGYVSASCEAIARALGVHRFALGFQNHTGRGGAWTAPENRTLIHGIRARNLVVVPVSFMHEQSETLVDLDQDLRREVEALGMQFHRVPIPQENPRFVNLLADVVMAAARVVSPGGNPATGLGADAPPSLQDPAGDPTPSLVPCRCVDAPWAFCVGGGDGT